MKSSTSTNIHKLTFAALLIAIGWLLPLLTGQIPQIGNMLLPMHIPVLIGGVILGPWYGLIIGLVLPISRFFVFGAPIIYPIGFAMTFELATYGLITGLVFRNIRHKNIIVRTIIALSIAMICGRIVWGVVQYIIGIFGTDFTLMMFVQGAFIIAWPGIIIQFIIIPPIVKTFSQLGAFKFNE